MNLPERFKLMKLVRVLLVLLLVVPIIIDNNLYEEISIDIIASTLCYDRFYIMKTFKKELGISIVTYIN